VSVKVSVFAWRFMENWIPALDNLFKMGILNIDAQHCVLGCGSNELLSRLSFACDMAHKVWCGVLHWLEIQSAFHNNQIVHAHHFNGLPVPFFKYNAPKLSGWRLFG
jgi:hypothetical protein